MSIFTFAPLAPAVCDGADCLPAPTLADVVGTGQGHLLGGGGLDRVAEHLAQLGGVTPDPMWPAAVAASFAVGIVALLLAAYIGYAIRDARSVK